MDESALRTALAASETCWSSLEHWLWACAGVVFLGVVLEIMPVISEYLTELREFRRGTICSPERPMRLKFALEVLGSVLVTIGVFGELVVGIKMAKVETNMRDDTAQLVSIIDQKAAEARKRAAHAELELARLKAPRSLSKAQQRRLVAELRPFSGTPIMVVFDNFDPEANNLAIQLMVALLHAGWKVDTRPIIVGTAGYSPQIVDNPGVTVSSCCGNLKRGGFHFPRGGSPEPRRHSQKACRGWDSSARTAELGTLRIIPIHQLLWSLARSPYRFPLHSSYQN